jgi:serine/threonine-protein kinase
MDDSPEEESLVGRRLFGEYTMIKKLGEGGMGAVYLLRQDQIDQHIAVKVLHGRAANSDELVQRFYREAKSLSMLSHPNIIDVFIFGRTDDGLIYMAMEYIDGQSLRELVDSVGALEELRAIRIIIQCLSALEEAHSQGIIHRDMKPDNILLKKHRDGSDRAKVLDFGIAKVKEPPGTPQQKLTQVGVVYGTPEYLSPEQAQATDLDHRSDLYSLGVVFFELLTGSVPFDAPTAVTILTMHVFEKPPKPSDVAPHPIHPDTEAIVLKALEKKPADRFADAAAFREALEAREAVLTGGPGPEAKTVLISPDDFLPSRDKVPNPQLDTTVPIATATEMVNLPSPPRPRRGSSDSGDGTRKMLIAIIVFAVIALLGVAGGLGTILVMKAQAGG